MAEEQDDPFAKYGGSEVKQATVSGDPFAKYGGSEVKKNNLAGSSDGSVIPLNKGRTSDNYFPADTPIPKINNAPALKFELPKTPDYKPAPVTLPKGESLLQQTKREVNDKVYQDEQDAQTRSLLKDPNYLKALGTNAKDAYNKQLAQYDDPGSQYYKDKAKAEEENTYKGDIPLMDRVHALNNSIYQGLGSYGKGVIRATGTLAKFITPEGLISGARYDQATGKWLDAADNMVQSATMPLNEKEEAEINKGGLNGMVNALANYAPAIADAERTGGMSFFFNDYEKGYEDINKQARDNNIDLSEGQKQAFATVRGTASALLMTHNLHSLLGNASEGTADKLLNTVTTGAIDDIAKAGEDFTPQNVSKAVVNKLDVLEDKVKNFGAQSLKGSLISAGDMSAFEAANIGTEHLINTATGKQVFDPSNDAQRIQEALKNGLALGVVGSLLKSPMLLSKGTDERSSVIENLYKDPSQENADNIKNTVQSHLESKGFDQKDIDETKATVDSIHQVVQTLPKGLPPEKQQQISELILNRKDVEKQQSETETTNAAKDPVFGEQHEQQAQNYQDVIDGINDKIKSIASDKPLKYFKDEEGQPMKQFGDEEPEKITENRYYNEKPNNLFRNINTENNEKSSNGQSDQETGKAEENVPTKEEVVNSGVPDNAPEIVEKPRYQIKGDKVTKIPESTESTVDNFKIGDQDEFYHASPTKRVGPLREREASQFGKGTYFSTNKDLVINEFGKELTKVNLKLEKPLYTGSKEEGKVGDLAAKNWNKDNLTWDKENEQWVDKQGKSKGDYPLTATDLGEKLPVKYFSDAAKELGYDAIIDKNSHTYDNEIVVLDPKKIIYKEEPTNATKIESAGKMDVGEQAGNGETVGKGNAEEQNTPKQGEKPSEKAKALADKIRSLKSDKSKLHGGLQGVGAAIWDGGLETAASIIENGGKLADAIQAAVKHIKENSDEKDEDKIRTAVTQDLSSLGIEDRYQEPEMIEANNAYMDAKVEGKFGTEVLDHIISSLKDTNLENIVNGVKSKMRGDPEYLTKTRNRVLENQGGSEEDQAALLMDQYTLKGRESQVIDEINSLTDKKSIQEKQKQLSDIQDEILDNATANRQIGRQASSVFRLRQVAVDNSANLHDMREKFMASEGLKKLTPEQEDFIRQQYQGIRDAEEKVKQIKEQERKAREENKRLKAENEALKKIIADAKEKHDKSKQTTTERLTTIKKSIDHSKKELAKIFSANAFLNPEVYKHLKNIAVGKAEEIYVKTKAAVKLNDLVKSVLDEIKDVAPHITEKDVRDAISGNSSKPKPKSELQKNLQELKTQAGLIKKINDLENGIELQVKKHGESSNEVKQLQKQLTELKKGLKTDTDYESMQAGTLDTSTKPNTASITDKQKNINRYKAVQRQIAEVEEKLNKGDFETTAKQARELDKSPELKDAEHKLAVRKFQWDKGRKEALMKNAPWYKKLANNILQWQRFAVLSYPTTLAKLALVAAKGVAFKPFQLAFQQMTYYLMHAVGKATGRRDVSGMIYGKVRAASVAKFYSEFVRNFSIQNLKNAFSGFDEGDVLYGKSKYMEDYDMGSGFHNAFLEFPGRSHGYIKSFLKNPETAFAHEQLLQGYIEKSAQIEKQLQDKNLSDAKRNELEKQQQLYDPSNSETLERINSLAAEHGKWAILMNKNNYVEKWRTFLNSVGLPGLVLKTEMPILKLPMNYAARFFLTKYGLVQAVLGKRDFSQFKEGKFELQHPGLIHIALKGAEDLSDQHKELLSKSLTYGSQGAAAVVAGMLLHNQIQKNKDGSIDIGDVHIPKIALDSPLDESFVSGVTYGQKMEDNNDDWYSWATNFAESDIDVVKKMPFVSQLKYGFFANAIQGLYAEKQETTDKILQKAIDKKIADMITPGFLKDIAKYQQDDLVPQPEGLKETVESGLPFLWNYVEKVKTKP